MEKVSKSFHTMQLNSFEDEDVIIEAHHPAFGTESERLDTFTEWPLSIPVKAKDLAKAGFYYTGIGDRTRCYFCGSVFKQWEAGDDPWEEHARWFNKCHFLRLMKGMEYIKSVELKYKINENISEVIVNDNVDVKKENVIEEDDDDDYLHRIDLCKICYKNERNVVFLPCGHVMCCVECGFQLKICPVCRKNIQTIKKLYFM